jgi:erythromycin esterase-like protein
MNAQHRAKAIARWGLALILLGLLGAAMPMMAQNPTPPETGDNPAWQPRQRNRPNNQVAASPSTKPTASLAASPEMQVFNNDQLERRGAYRLLGNDPNLPFDDLEPLKDIIGGAKLVGLGHEWPSAGSSYIMKHRVIRFLVEKMGFRVMGIASPYFWALSIEYYIQGDCLGLPNADLRNATFRNYAATEFGDQVEWMCQWNKAHPNDRLHVFGYDAQLAVKENMSALSAVMGKMGFGASDPLMSGMNACDKMTETYWPDRQMPQTSYDQCQASLTGTMNYLIQNEKTVRKQLSREDYFMALAYARTQQAYQDELFFWTSDFSRAIAAREAGQGDVALYIRQALYPKERIVLWSENESVAMNGLNWAVPKPSFIVGGDIWERSLGRNYVAIGMVSLHLNLNWLPYGMCGETNLRYGGPGPYVEDALHAAGGGSTLLVDLRSRKRDKHDDANVAEGIAGEASTDHQPRERGGRSLLDPNMAYAWVEAEPVIMQDTFDALIYQETVTAAHYVYDPKCPGF